MDTEKPAMQEVSPFPPMACRSLRWSTVICRISAFSSLDDPWREWKYFTLLHLLHFNQAAVCLLPLTQWLNKKKNYNNNKKIYIKKHFDTWGFTCFSKALGTSLLSSDRLWLMRSLRLFSMIYATRTIRGTVSTNPPHPQTKYDKLYDSRL